MLTSNETKTVTLRTSSGALQDVTPSGKVRYTANISLYDFKDVPNNRNLREPNPKSGCVASMIETVLYDEYSFLDNNSGVSIFASGVDFNPTTGVLTLTLRGRDGISDGGHTRLVSHQLAELGNSFPDSFVRAFIYDSSNYSDSEIRKIVISNNSSSVVTQDCLLDGTELCSLLQDKLPSPILDKIEIRKNIFKTLLKSNGKPYGPRDYMSLKTFSMICDMMNVFSYDCFNKISQCFPKDSEKGSLNLVIENKLNISPLIPFIPEFLKLWEYLESDIYTVLNNTAFVEDLTKSACIDFSTFSIKPSSTSKSLFYGYPIKLSSTAYYHKWLFMSLRACYGVDESNNVYCAVGDIFKFYEAHRYDLWRSIFIKAHNYQKERKGTHENKRYTKSPSNISSMFDSVMSFVYKYNSERLKHEIQ